MFQAQHRETINSTWNVVVSFKIIMTMSVTRQCFTTRHQTCKTKTETKTDFLVSDRSCHKTDGLRPRHWIPLTHPPNPYHNHNPTITLTLTPRDPDYHQNVMVSYMAHVPPFHWFEFCENRLSSCCVILLTKIKEEKTKTNDDEIISDSAEVAIPVDVGRSGFRHARRKLGIAQCYNARTTAHIRDSSHYSGARKFVLKNGAS